MFKPGDQVICINAKCTNVLIYGATYIVSNINFPSIMEIPIIELEGISILQLATRFKAVEAYPTLRCGYV